MAENSAPSKSDEEVWLEALGKAHSETLVPAFWKTLGTNAEQWAAAVTVGDFWKKAKERLPYWRKEYTKSLKGKLIVPTTFPDFVGKGHKRAKEKLFNQFMGSDSEKKKEYLKNSFNYDSPNADIICSLNDLVRCRIPCSYIDGVEFLTNKLLDLAKEENCFYSIQKEGKIQGYFAQHLCIKQQVILKRGGIPKIVEVVCEIQLASEMASQMWNKTHVIYESVRNKQTSPADWQWDPSNAEFITNQLGHMIHLADGLLVQLKMKMD